MYNSTERVKNISYAIRDVVIFAQQLEKEGKEIIYLNIGDPCLWDFDTPDHIKNAIAEAVTNGRFNRYVDSKGLPELRERIIERERKINNINLTTDDVVITSGVTEGLQMLFAAIINPGDEVLVSKPTYPPFIALCKFFDGVPVYYDKTYDNGWIPDIDYLEKAISEKTTAIVIVNPNNPTGAVYDEKTLKQIVDICAENDIIIICDEIYDQYIFDGKHVGISSIAKDTSVIVLNGFSKAYLVPGWRLGYLYTYDPEEKLSQLREDVEKQARLRLCANAPAQKAAVVALRGPQDHLKKINKHLRERRDIVYNRFEEMTEIHANKPRGSFYIFPKVVNLHSRWKDDEEFVKDLLRETGVLVVHGSGFGMARGSGLFRLVYLAPSEILEDSMDRLENFMKSGP